MLLRGAYAKTQGGVGRKRTLRIFACFWVLAGLICLSAPAAELPANQHSDKGLFFQHAFGHSMGEQRYSNFQAFGGGFGHAGGGAVAHGEGGGHR